MRRSRGTNELPRLATFRTRPSIAVTRSTSWWRCPRSLRALGSTRAAIRPRPLSPTSRLSVLPSSFLHPPPLGASSRSANVHGLFIFKPRRYCGRNRNPVPGIRCAQESLPTGGDLSCLLGWRYVASVGPAWFVSQRDSSPRRGGPLAWWSTSGRAGICGGRDHEKWPERRAPRDHAGGSLLGAVACLL